MATRDTAGIIRTRRYVSAPSGVYPAAVAPRRVGPLIAPPAPSPATATSMVVERPEPIAQPPIVVSAAPLALPDLEPIEAAAPWSLPELDAVATPLPQATVVPHRVSFLRTLVGAVLGGTLGCMIALILLALSDAEQLLPLLREPLTLWHSVEHPMVRVSALAVALGFLLLGVVVARRTSTPQH